MDTWALEDVFVIRCMDVFLNQLMNEWQIKEATAYVRSWSNMNLGSREVLEWNS